MSNINVTTRMILSDLEAVRIHSLFEFDCEPIDVRLQVTDGGWWLRVGDASFDTDHGGWWGAESVSGSDTDDDLLSIAESLISQAEDHRAQCEG